MADNENKIIDLAEFLKKKLEDEKDMAPAEKQLAEVGIDAVANALIGLINVERHLDRIATALEKQGRMMQRAYNLPEEN